MKGPLEHAPVTMGGCVERADNKCVGVLHSFTFVLSAAGCIKPETVAYEPRLVVLLPKTEPVSFEFEVHVPHDLDTLPVKLAG